MKTKSTVLGSDLNLTGAKIDSFKSAINYP